MSFTAALGYSRGGFVVDGSILLGEGVVALLGIVLLMGVAVGKTGAKNFDGGRGRFVEASMKKAGNGACFVVIEGAAVEESTR